MSKHVRPSGLTDDHLYYLDLLRETGVTNMLGAGIYLENEFGINRTTAEKYLRYWMTTFGERHAPRDRKGGLS